MIPQKPPTMIAQAKDFLPPPKLADAEYGAL
jgi:hypothetical protein